MKTANENHPVIDLLARLIACPSVNPGHRGNAEPLFGEARLMDLLKNLLEDWGAETSLQFISSGRDNLIARFAGKDRTRSLMLEAHADTVQVEDMTIPPFEPTLKDGRLYGRGSCDTKGSMAAMLSAIRRVLDEDGQPPTDVLFVSTCNEELGATGARHLMESGFRADAAIVGEPTELNIVTTHKGAVRWRIKTTGVAAHSSVPSQGVNAISLMQKIIAVIDGPVAEALAARTDPILGSPTVCVGTVCGGTQVNVVPSSCRIEVDRRLIPSETREQALQEICDHIDVLKVGTPDMEYHTEGMDYYPPLWEEPDGHFARLVRKACEQTGRTAAMESAAYATNGGYFKASGIPSIIIGPGCARQAHTVDEFIEVDQVVQAVDTYAAIIRAFGGT